MVHTGSHRIVNRSERLGNQRGTDRACWVTAAKGKELAAKSGRHEGERKQKSP